MVETEKVGNRLSFCGHPFRD